jgi:hypothetical protein
MTFKKGHVWYDPNRTSPVPNEKYTEVSIGDHRHGVPGRLPVPDTPLSPQKRAIANSGREDIEATHRLLADIEQNMFMEMRQMERRIIRTVVNVVANQRFDQRNDVDMKSMAVDCHRVDNRTVKIHELLLELAKASNMDPQSMTRFR